MKLIAVVALLAVAATPLISGNTKAKAGGGPSGKTEDRIRRLHNEIVQAQLNSDTAALDRLWADDHIFTNPLGVVQTKAQRLAEIQSGRRRAILKGQRQGQDISGQYRGIDVYVKKQGRWQVVAAHATRIAQP